MPDNLPREAEAMLEAVCFAEGLDAEAVLDVSDRRRHISRARKLAWTKMAERWSHRLIASWFGVAQQSVSEGIATLRDTMDRPGR